MAGGYSTLDPRNKPNPPNVAGFFMKGTQMSDAIPDDVTLPDSAGSLIPDVAEVEEVHYGDAE